MLKYYLDGKLIKEVPIYYQGKTGEEDKHGLFEFFSRYFSIYYRCENKWLIIFGFYDDYWYCFCVLLMERWRK